VSVLDASHSGPMVNSPYAVTERRAGFAEAPVSLVAVVVLASAFLGAIAVLRPEFALLALVGLAFVPVVLVSPITGLCALTVLSFLEEFSTISGGLSSTKVLGALLILAWLAAAATRPGRDRREAALVREQPGLSTALVLFVAWAAMSILWAEAPDAAQSSVARYAPNILLFPVVVFAIRTPRHVVWLLSTFVASSLAVVAIGVLTGTLDEGDRLKGAGLNPNQLGGYLAAAAIFAAAAAASRRRSPPARAAALVVSSLTGLGVLMTGSRGALVGLAAALAVVPVALGKGRRLGAFALVVTALLGTVWWYAAFAPEGVVQRVTNPEEGGGSGREDLWLVGWRMAEAEPFHGVGAGNFPNSAVHYLLKPGLTERDETIVDDQKVAHNIYLTVLAELGAVGLTFFLVILGASLRCCLKAARAFARQGDELLELTARALLIALVGLLVAGFFSSAVYSKQMWLLLALGPALLALANRRAAPQLAEVTSTRRRTVSTRAAAPVRHGASP
jgi:O-antigen ligase